MRSARFLKMPEDQSRTLAFPDTDNHRPHLRPIALYIGYFHR